MKISHRNLSVEANFFLLFATLMAAIAVAILANSHVSLPALATQNSANTEFSAYIDPALHTAVSGSELSVIIATSNVDETIEAVEHVGGHVTSNLWLIDAVGATIPRGSLEALAATKGITSIVSNHSVAASDSGQLECPNPHAPCASRPGWVTDRQEKKAQTRLPFNADHFVAVVPLSNGSLLAFEEKEVVTLLNPDGSIQQTVTDLDFEKLSSAPVVGSNDIVYFMGELKGSHDKSIIYAMDANGQVLWNYNRRLLVQGLALSPDGQFVYAVQSRNNPVLHVLDAANGNLISKSRPTMNKPGETIHPPVVDAMGIVYLQSSGQHPNRNNRYANVVAINPANFAETMWRFEGNAGDHLLKLDWTPLIGAGMVYLFSGEDKQVLALDKQNGNLVGSASLEQEIEGQPHIGGDGTLYIPSEKRVYAFNPDLTLRFEFQDEAGKFGTPLFSPDGSTIYLTDSKTLLAVDSMSGQTVWTHEFKGEIKAAPQIAENGDIIVGSDDKDFVIISPQGNVETRLRLDDKFGRVVAAGADDTLLIQVGDKDLVTIGQLAEQWDESLQEIQPTEIKDEWEIVNTVAIDVGADQVHETTAMLPNKHGELVETPITGAGVTIAVLDSGVYVDGYVKDLLSSDHYATKIDKQYMGQVDFVGDGREGGCDEKDYNAVQGYCYYKWDKSLDPYGHGSHVAGIIWSQITDASTSVSMGIAPGAELVSVRVLGEDGTGTYEDLIEGIQWVVENKDNPELDHPIRIMNLSLSAEATVPYFVDPINRAVEEAWAAGIVVLAAAGNEGGGAETITVPGNDPYIITVGAINTKRTPGYWGDDIIPEWSSRGPTLDGFIKPDVLAPGSQIISFMPNDDDEIARLLHNHPDYVETMSLFRMNGTSMATAVTSGVVALMLQVDPSLTPDQVKFRLMYTAYPAVTGETESDDSELLHSLLEQGAGRIWAPEAVLATDIRMQTDNEGMDIHQDLAHGWMLLDDNGQPVLDEEGYPLIDPAALAFHYHGFVQRMVSDDGQVYLYYVEDTENNEALALGAVNAHDMSWLTIEDLQEMNLVFRNDASLTWTTDDVWGGGSRFWGGGSRFWGGGNEFWGGGSRFWGGGSRFWGGGSRFWGGGSRFWGGGSRFWGGGSRFWGGGSRFWGGGSRFWGGGHEFWGGGSRFWGGGSRFWGGGLSAEATSVGANKWVEDNHSTGTTIHSADLDVQTEWISTDGWKATVQTTVRDDFQTKIGNVSVTGYWSHDPTQLMSCLTEIDGSCTLDSGLVAEELSTVTFHLTELVHEELPYVPTDNQDLDGNSDGSMIEAAVPSYGSSVHVSDIDGASAWVDSSSWTVTYSFEMRDDQGLPIANAEIAGKWVKGLEGSWNCTSDENGKCTFSIAQIPSNVNKVKVKVLSITHASLIYEAKDNFDPDGDSNGTKLKVERPES